MHGVMSKALVNEALDRKHYRAMRHALQCLQEKSAAVGRGVVEGKQVCDVDCVVAAVWCL